MNSTIYKFERDMLRGEDIHIHKKENHTWTKQHWHNYYEMIYYKGCRGVCRLNGEEQPLSDSCIFLLTPKDFHEINTEGGEDSHSFIISFSEQIADKKIIDALTAGPIILHGVSRRLEDKIEELYEIFLEKNELRERHLCHLFNCILIDVLENGGNADAELHSIDPVVRESITLMLSDPAYQFSLDYFADRFKLTKSYFSRLFHESTGIPYKRYLTTLRLEYAKRLLRDSAMPIIDVGYECGFNSTSQFLRTFKKETGATPSQYRNNKTK